MMDTSRRSFIQGLCLACAAVGLSPLAAHAALPRAPLSLPRERLRAYYPVVVIGSGYGGSVMAARLSASYPVAVLERGREWLPAEFPTTQAGVLSQIRSAANPLGLFDYRAGASLDALVGSGLGGTSLINANVVIAPDVDAFDTWPEAIRSAYRSGAMRVFEDRVRQTVGIEAVAGAELPRKTVMHASTTARRARAGVAVSHRALDLAVNLSSSAPTNAYGVAQAPCTRCGDCVIGCRVGAKKTLDVNYLALARQRGAELFARIEVDHIERLGSGWRVHFVEHRVGQTPLLGSVLADRVVLSAGALGSTGILLRSRAHGLALSATLGTRVSANGDYLGLGYNTAVQTDSAGHGEAARWSQMKAVGPTITSAASYAATAPANRYLIEEGAWPSALVDTLRYALPPTAPTGDVPYLARIARDLRTRRADGALNHSMVYLGIGHDSAAGRVELDASGQPRIAWPGLVNEPFVQRMAQEMRAHAEAFGGALVASPRSHPLFGGALTTVHPLGGAPMGNHAGEGVVDDRGRVYDPRGGSTTLHPGLHVVDGAFVRSSVGVNPLLTISALAERCAATFS